MSHYQKTVKTVDDNDYCLHLKKEKLEKPL